MKILTIAAIFFLTLSLCSAQTNQTSTANTNTSNLYPSSSTVIPHHSDWTKGHYKEKIAEFKANPLYRKQHYRTRWRLGTKI